MVLTEELDEYEEIIYQRIKENKTKNNKEKEAEVSGGRFIQIKGTTWNISYNVQ